MSHFQPYNRHRIRRFFFTTIFLVSTFITVIAQQNSLFYAASDGWTTKRNTNVSGKFCIGTVTPSTTGLQDAMYEMDTSGIELHFLFNSDWSPLDISSSTGLTFDYKGPAIAVGVTTRRNEEFELIDYFVVPAQSTLKRLTYTWDKLYKQSINLKEISSVFIFTRSEMDTSGTITFNNLTINGISSILTLTKQLPQIHDIKTDKFYPGNTTALLSVTTNLVMNSDMIMNAKLLNSHGTEVVTTTEVSFENDSSVQVWFDVPQDLEPGFYKLVLVVNGIEVSSGKPVSLSHNPSMAISTRDSIFDGYQGNELKVVLYASETSFATTTAKHVSLTKDTSSIDCSKIVLLDNSTMVAYFSIPWGAFAGKYDINVLVDDDTLRVSNAVNIHYKSSRVDHDVRYQTDPYTPNQVFRYVAVRSGIIRIQTDGPQSNYSYLDVYNEKFELLNNGSYYSYDETSLWMHMYLNRGDTIYFYWTFQEYDSTRTWYIRSFDVARASLGPNTAEAVFSQFFEYQSPDSSDYNITTCGLTTSDTHILLFDSVFNQLLYSDNECDFQSNVDFSMYKNQKLYFRLRTFDSIPTSYSFKLSKRVAITSLELPPTLGLIVGDSLKINPVVMPLGYTQALNWFVEHDSIVTVSPSGVITARAAGVTSLTVSSDDFSKSDVCNITVVNGKIPVKAIWLEPLTKMVVGETSTLTAVISPVNATNKSVTWTSSNNSVASVVDGVVTARTKGTSLVVATSSDGSFKDTTILMVASSFPPVISPLPVRTINSISTAVTFNLYNYVTDDKTPDSSLILKLITPPTTLSATLARGILTLVPAQGFVNSARVMVTVADENGVADTLFADIRFSRDPNTPPVIHTIPSQTIRHGTTFESIPLSQYVADDYTPQEQISWTTSVSPNIVVTIDKTTQTALLTLTKTDITMSDTITFYAADIQGLKDSAKVVFTISKLNNTKPLIIKIPSQKQTDSQPFITINLINHVKDDFTPPAQIKWSFVATRHYNMSIANNIVYISIIDPSWKGTDTVTFFATDAGGLFDSQKVAFTQEKNFLDTGVPVIDFKTDRQGNTFGVGQKVHFTRNTQNAVSWLWRFEGGNPSETDDNDPYVTYSRPGLYKVSLSATNPYGTDSLVREMFVTVVGISPRPAAICRGEKLSLAVNITNFSKYTWNTGNTTPVLPSFTPLHDTVISVKITEGNHSFYDTLRVTVRQPVDLGPDVTLCQGNSRTIKPGGAFTSFNWNDSGNSTVDSLVVTKAGRVQLVALDNAGCSSRDSLMVIVNPIPAINLGKDSNICRGAGMSLDAGAGFNYSWSNKQKTRTIEVKTAGVYAVTITDNNKCTNADTIAIGVRGAYPEKISLVTHGEKDDTYTIIAWKRTKGKNTKKYVLYREGNKVNDFSKKIGESNFNRISYLKDSLADMSIKLFRYKLATIDSVCNDTAWSTPHMTMHLQTFDTKTPGVVGLRWNAYEGLDIRSYVVYKYTSDNVEHILDTLANNNDEISFNDTTSPSDNVRYRVSMLLPARVDLEEFLKSDGGPYSLSLSNMAESKILSVYQPGYDSVKIYPVPVSERLVVELPSRPLLIQLVTVTGTVLYQETTPASRVSIDMSGLVPGAYFVRIHTHNAIITRPISK